MDFFQIKSKPYFDSISQNRVAFFDLDEKLQTYTWIIPSVCEACIKKKCGIAAREKNVFHVSEVFTLCCKTELFSLVKGILLIVVRFYTQTVNARYSQCFLTQPYRLK